MSVPGDEISVDLDAEIVERTREQLGSRAESDAAVVERALNAYLLGRLLASLKHGPGCRSRRRSASPTKSCTPERRAACTKAARRSRRTFR
jgi:hypothetical protein